MDEDSPKQESRKPNKRPPLIGREIDIFVSHIDSLANTLPLAMSAIKEANEKVSESYKQFETKHITKKDVDGKKILLVDAAHNREFVQISKELSNLFIAARTLPRSFLVSLISQYDAFLGRLIRALFYLRPETLNTVERALTFSEIVKFSSLDEAREYIIEKEVETVLRKSHFDQIEWLEKKFNTPLHKGLSIWPYFIEITERRNLFVHCDGVISTQYLNICGREGASLSEKFTVGSRLEATASYFKRAFEVIFEMGVKLAHVLWRVLKPEHREAADNHLINIGYELINEEKYDLAKNIMDFCTDTLKQYSSERARRVFIVNRAQSYKWSGDEKKAREIISAEDWSAVSDTFKLAEAVLIDDFSKAVDLMHRIGRDSNELPMAIYREWPLFKKFRETDEFLKAYNEIADEPFNQVELPVDTANIQLTQEDVGLLGILEKENGSKMNGDKH